LSLPAPGFSPVMSCAWSEDDVTQPATDCRSDCGWLAVATASGLPPFQPKQRVRMFGRYVVGLGIFLLLVAGRPAIQGTDGSALRQSNEVPKPSPSQVLGRTPEESSSPKPDMRQCPHCSKPIAKTATRCGYCWAAVKRVA